MDELKDTTKESPVSSPPRVTLRSLRAATELDAISRALEQVGWNRRRAAELLGVSYRGLLYKIRQYNITRRVNQQLSPFAEE
ncbi:MAG: helix-turn-helix domain-containing protein [Terriglobales bacterium]